MVSEVRRLFILLLKLLFLLLLLQSRTVCIDSQCKDGGHVLDPVPNWSTFIASKPYGVHCICTRGPFSFYSAVCICYRYFTKLTKLLLFVFWNRSFGLSPAVCQEPTAAVSGQSERFQTFHFMSLHCVLAVLF